MTLLQTAVRPATLNDIPFIHTIEQQNHARWNEITFQKELSLPHSHTCIVEYDSRIIAFITFWIIDREMEIQNIAVEKQYQHKGIGTQLLIYLDKVVQTEKILTIYLEVREKNVAAVKFYQKMGFTMYGKREKYYQDDNALLMKKQYDPE